MELQQKKDNFILFSCLYPRTYNSKLKNPAQTNRWQRIKQALVPPDYSSPVKAILILFYFSTVTVGLDLGKDMAKGEFEYFEGILTESHSVDVSPIFDSLIIDPPIIGEILNLQFIPPTSDVVQPYLGRGPPIPPTI